MTSQRNRADNPAPCGPGRTGALIAAGALGMLLGQPNLFLHLPPLVLAFPFSLCLLAALTPSGRQAFLHCWLLGLAGHAAGLYWLVNPMHDVGGLSYELAWPGVLLLSAYLACFPALAGLCIRRLRFYRPAGHRKSGSGPDLSSRANSVAASVAGSVARALLSGCAYAGGEVLCGTLFTGFPWLSLSSAFALWPAWVQAASLIGSYGLSACFAAAACLGASALLAPSRSGGLAAAVLALALAGVMPLYGGHRLSSPPPKTAGPPLPILMVQGNIDQHRKWDQAFQESVVTLYLDLSARAIRAINTSDSPLTAGGPALVLWPETAMPFYFQAHPEYAGRLRRFAAAHKLHLAFGALGVERDPQGKAASNRMYNRLYLLDANGRTAAFYDKEHLVPFGEYIPFASSLTFLRNIAQGLDFSSGLGTGVLPLDRPRTDPPADSPPAALSAAPAATDEAGRDIALGALICYEAIFPSLAQKRVANGATALVNISNDGWFGKSSAPLQHLGLTAMRAVEQARPIARATNTGYTALIDARGRIRERADELFTAGVLPASLHPSAEITVYHRIHPVPEVLLAATLFVLLIAQGSTYPGKREAISLDTESISVSPSQ